MEFKICMDDLNEIHSHYGKFQAKTAELYGQNLSEKISELTAYSGFAGVAAEAIKAYFNETHGKLLQIIQTAVGDLYTSLTHEYYNRYREGAIEEANDWGLLDNQELHNKQVWVMNTLKQQLVEEETKSKLGAAFSAIPADISIPSLQGASNQADNLAQQLGALAQTIQELIANIENAENNGKAAFSDQEGRVQSLLRGILDLINAYKDPNFDIATYTEGGFSMLASDLGLIDIFNESLLYQDTYHDELIETANFVDSQMTEREIRKKEQEKRLWQILALGAAVISVVAGVVAVVGSGGAALPVLFGVISTVNGAMNIKDRIDEMNGQENGLWSSYTHNGSTVIKVGGKDLGYNFIGAALGEKSYNEVNNRAGKGAIDFARYAVKTGWDSGDYGTWGTYAGDQVVETTAFVGGLVVDKKLPVPLSTNISATVAKAGKGANVLQFGVDRFCDFCDARAQSCQDSIDNKKSDLNARQEARTKQPTASTQFGNVFA